MPTLKLKDEDIISAHTAMLRFMDEILIDADAVEEAITEAKKNTEKTQEGHTALNLHQMERLEKVWGTSWKEAGPELEKLFGYWMEVVFPTMVTKYKLKSRDIEKQKDMINFLIDVFLMEHWFAASSYVDVPEYRRMVQLRRVQLWPKVEERGRVLCYDRLHNVVEKWVPEWSPPRESP
ncbi:MAG: hypothetical protein Q9224_005395 [Gallowayella concinna]